MKPSDDIHDPSILQSFLVGDLDADRSALVEEALRTDPDLLAKLVEPGNDTLLQALRCGTRMNYPANAELKELATRLQYLAADNYTPDQTKTFSGNFEDRGADEEEEILQMLGPPTTSNEIGKLGSYRILRMLGNGGMGAVFEAVDDRLDRHVALKVMKPRIARRADARDRFLREARATAKVEHPNVVAIFEVNEDRDTPFLAMPMLKGQSLDQRLKSGVRVPLPLALEIAKQIATGLAAAHKTGLIHRDIKPANIWLESGDAELTPRVRILDFGLARIAESDMQITQTGVIVGTPAYMAPEQGRTGTIDHRADIFSLGVTLYEMTTGRRPFKGRDTMSILMSLAADTPELPHVIQPTIPPMISALIMRLLEKDPIRRPQTAREVAAQLAKFLVPSVENFPTSSSTGLADPWAGIDESVDIAPAAPAKPEVANRNHKRRNWFFASGFAVLLLVGGIVVIIRDKDGKKVAEAIVPPGGKVEIVDDAPQPKQPDTAPPQTPTAPFGEKRARQHQDAWAKYLGVPVEDKNSLGMRLRLIPPGTFSMVPEHEVKISKAYWIGVYEVTVGEFAAFAKDKKYKTSSEASGEGGVMRIDGKDDRKPEYTWKHASISRGDNYPVGQLSWDDCAAFCKWLSEKEKKTYRLPTEAEWEWACRTGSITTYHFGDDVAELGDYAWYLDNSKGQTHPVGQKKANAWGLFDMHGNIAEYCQDWYADDLPTKDQTDPQGPKEGDTRSIRGYGFFDNDDGVTCSARAAYSPDFSMIHFGFRVVCEIPPKQK